MTPFKQLDAKCFPLDAANVDTDQLIPARFMQESRSVGYGQFLLYDQRFDSNNIARESFRLNQTRLADAGIMVAKRNFGAGSSREAAVYALVDYGFRCVIAPSFGDIFSSNAVNNGLLPALVTEADAQKLIDYCQNQLASSLTTAPIISVDLENKQIRCADRSIAFEIKSAWRSKLLNGWDDIELTQAYSENIAQFYTDYQLRSPWAVTPQDNTILAVNN